MLSIPLLTVLAGRHLLMLVSEATSSAWTSRCALRLLLASSRTLRSFFAIAVSAFCHPLSAAAASLSAAFARLVISTHCRSAVAAFLLRQTSGHRALPPAGSIAVCQATPCCRHRPRQRASNGSFPSASAALTSEVSARRCSNLDTLLQLLQAHVRGGQRICAVDSALDCDL